MMPRVLRMIRSFRLAPRSPGIDAPREDQTNEREHLPNRAAKRAIALAVELNQAHEEKTQRAGQDVHELSPAVAVPARAFAQAPAGSRRRQ